MSRTILRRISWPVVLAGLTAPFLANCGCGMPGLPGGGGLPGMGNCPDMAKVEAIESFDFGKEFKLKADVGAKIKAGAEAAVEMKDLAERARTRKLKPEAAQNGASENTKPASSLRANA